MTDIAELLVPDTWLSAAGGPRYLQLRQRIRSAVNQGRLKDNDPLPSEREIAAITKLSRVTVRKAVAELVRDGMIIQKRGSGSFVAPQVRRVEQSLSLLTSFTEDMTRRGMTVSSDWLERGVFTPSPQEMFTLGLSRGEMVARIARLRSADQRPLAIERAALSTSLLPDPEKVIDSLYAVLDEDNNRPVRAIQRISAANVADEDAALLGMAPGAAGLIIERVSYLETGKAVEFTRSIYRGDAYDFVAELTIARSTG